MYENELYLRFRIEFANYVGGNEDKLNDDGIDDFADNNVRVVGAREVRINKGIFQFNVRSRGDAPFYMKNKLVATSRQLTKMRRVLKDEMKHFPAKRNEILTNSCVVVKNKYAYLSTDTYNYILPS